MSEERMLWAQRLFGVCALVVVALSCTHAAKTETRQDEVLPTADSVTAERDLTSELRKLSQLVSGTELTGATCVPLLRREAAHLRSSSPQEFRRDHLHRTAPELLSASWQTRQALHEKMRLLYRDSGLEAPCYEAARELFRVLRTVEDHLGEWWLSQSPGKAPPSSPVFGGGAPHVMTKESTPTFEPNKNLRSGDVLISRGNAFTSAAIARLGDTQSQFSHMAFVYREPDTGRLMTIEAHIEVGTVVAPLPVYLQDGKVRAALYRFKDPTLAERAAEIMYRRAQRASARGANIPYDFGMDLSDSHALHCSELVSFGFALASDRAAPVPAFQSTFRNASPYFMKSLGIKVGRSFVPGDLELDPSFELVAEWRDFSRMRDTRHKDATLIALYDWMNRHDYTLRAKKTAAAMRNVVWAARRWPLFSLALSERFPTNMPLETFNTILAMDDVAAIIKDELARADDLATRHRGVSMSLPELLTEAERLRKKDLSSYLSASADARARYIVADEKGRSLFHWGFRPSTFP